MQTSKSIKYAVCTMLASATILSTVEASMFNAVEARQIARRSYHDMQVYPTTHGDLPYTGITMSVTTDGPTAEVTGLISLSGALDYAHRVVRRDESVVTVTTSNLLTRTLELSQPTLDEALVTTATTTPDLSQSTSTETSMAITTVTQNVCQPTSTDTTTVTKWLTVEHQSSTTLSPGPSSADTSEDFDTPSTEPSSTEASTTMESTIATSTTDTTPASTTTAANNGTFVLSEENKWALEPLSTESRKHANWAVKKLLPGLVVPSVIFDGGVFFFFRWLHEIKQRVDLHPSPNFSPDMTNEAYETATRLIFDTEVARHKDGYLRPHTNEAAHEAAVKLQEDVAREALEFVDTGFRGNHDNPLTIDDIFEADDVVSLYSDNFLNRGNSWREELERAIDQGTLDNLAGPASKPSPDEDPSEAAYPDDPEMEPVVEPEVAPVVPPGEVAPVVVPPGEVAPVVVPPEAVPVVAPGTPGFPHIPLPNIHLPGSDDDKDKKKDGKDKEKDGKKKVSFALTTMVTTTKPKTSTQESTTTTSTSSSTTTSSTSKSSTSTSSTSTSSTTTSSTTTTTSSTKTQNQTPTSTPKDKNKDESNNNNTPTSQISTTDTGHNQKWTFSLLGKNWPKGVHEKYLRNELRQCKGKALDHYKVHSDAEAAARGYDFWVEGRIEGKKGFPKRCFQVAVKQVGGGDPWA